MKKTIILIACLLTTCAAAFAQNVVNPQLDQSDDFNCRIAKIETDSQFTIVTFAYTAGGDNSWVQLNKQTYIQTDQSNDHYDYVKSENIALAPAKHTFAKAGDKLDFKVYFKKIPAAAKEIDIIERAGYRRDGITFLNFYNVSLTKSLPMGSTRKVKVTDVVLLPPPPVEQTDATTPPTEQPEGMQTAINSMEPMYKTMVKAMMDAQLAYFNQPGKTEEIAKLNKQYFDALVKQGFTNDQALKITISSGIMSKTVGGNGQ